MSEIAGDNVYVGIMIHLLSHSPSVRSVAGIDSSPDGRRGGESPMERSCKPPFAVAYIVVSILWIRGYVNIVSFNS